MESPPQFVIFASFCTPKFNARQSTNWFGSAAAIYDAYQKVLPKRKEKPFEQEKEQAETKIPADLFEGQGV